MPGVDGPAATSRDPGLAGKGDLVRLLQSPRRSSTGCRPLSLNVHFVAFRHGKHRGAVFRLPAADGDVPANDGAKFYDRATTGRYR